VGHSPRAPGPISSNSAGSRLPAHYALHEVIDLQLSFAPLRGCASCNIFRLGFIVIPPRRPPRSGASRKDNASLHLVNFMSDFGTIVGTSCHDPACARAQLHRTSGGASVPIKSKLYKFHHESATTHALRHEFADAQGRIARFYASLRRQALRVPTRYSS